MIQWLALAALSFANIACAYVIANRVNFWGLPAVPSAPWGNYLRFWVMPVVRVLGLVSPVLALVALLVRRWRPLALGLVALAAVLQVGYIGIEMHWAELGQSGAQQEQWRTP